ncbi:putative glycosylase ykvQ [Proteiniborus sp. DW1]|uniref:S-layer homology domain-containing protein n=1 Tax=Proteiniborus sp. DW1 TaxID=1889883 RepID=UPI00092E01A1|nr:S-layer homology domain-containing protein [Proteiniborus sp. DW1]SCG83240.1 putative glycosylase ykvQ [Proteiniborus sp. DW1]
MRNKKKLFISIFLVITMVLSIFLVKPEEGQADSKFNMTYLYFGDVNNQKSLVEKTKASLDVISPNYFNIDSDGSLLLTSLLSTEFISSMHSQNIKVVPFISNHWDRELGRIALKNREKLADEIVTAIKKYNLDGVNVDIENVTEVDRENYTDFVRILRSKLPEGKELSVAVAANPRGFTKGWHGSYDYEALAKYSDYLMIMAYDESYYGSKPGPVASKTFVESSIKYALNRVSPDKIVLGIPFFGRYWNENESVGGHGISLAKANSVIKHYNSDIYFDKATMSPYATFSIGVNDTKLLVNGKALTPGKYTVWFENEDSIKDKLQLVHKYNLKGTGSWSLGQELPSTWEYYKLWLNGKYFVDIDNNWAKNDILSMVGMGWMKGTSNVNFSPSETITRAQAAATLVRALELEDTNVINGEKFTDVPSTHWANKEVQIAAKKGIFVGVGNKKFAPDEPVTREQMATLLSRITNYGTDIKEYKNPFIDVKPSWSYDSIMQMNYAGVFVGFEDKTFRPRVKMTRAEMAAVLNRVKDSINFD